MKSLSLLLFSFLSLQLLSPALCASVTVFECSSCECLPAPTAYLSNGICGSTTTVVSSIPIQIALEVSCLSTTNSSSPWVLNVFAPSATCVGTPAATFAGSGHGSCSSVTIFGVPVSVSVNCNASGPTSPTTPTPTTPSPSTVSPTTPASLVLQSYEFSFSFFNMIFTSATSRVTSSRQHADALVPALAAMAGVEFEMVSGSTTSVTYSICQVAHGTCFIRDQLICSNTMSNVAACGSKLFIPLQQVNVMLLVKAGDQQFALSVYDQLIR